MADIDRLHEGASVTMPDATGGAAASSGGDLSSQHPIPTAAAEPRLRRRTVPLIALSVGVSSFSMNFWIPFLPLYLQEIGARTAAEAIFWLGIASTGSGIARLLTGPVWGVLADRYGRKVMFVRAMYSAGAVTAIAALAVSPWFIVISWTLMGILSGFSPAAVALASVLVPQSKLMRSLGTIQGAQYTGMMISPVLGALAASVVGYRGAIVAGSILPMLAATLVLVGVERDRVQRTAPNPSTPARRGGGVLEVLSLQFGLGVLTYFMIFVVSQVVRTTAPVAIEQIQGGTVSPEAVGIAFTLAGIGSVVGSLGVARFLSGSVSVRWSLAVLCLLAGTGLVFLGLAPTVAVFVVCFGAISLAQGAMQPASNTVIAASVPSQRRGTAFGLANSAQAISFIVGPMSAALFAATSLELGYVILAVALALVGLALFLFLREPNLTDEPRPVRAGPHPPAPSPNAGRGGAM
jgi:MFS transporter, DHA1 family, multidrug resistance protein